MPQDTFADYQERGPQYREAWEILARGCEVPPSIEVFDYQLEEARRARPGLGVTGLARQLAESYRRVDGWTGFDRDE